MTRDDSASTVAPERPVRWRGLALVATFWIVALLIAGTLSGAVSGRWFLVAVGVLAVALSGVYADAVVQLGIQPGISRGTYRLLSIAIGLAAIIAGLYGLGTS